ncbi:hypothetical protein ACQJBY_067811 [Aegilops geniculata]
MAGGGDNSQTNGGSQEPRAMEEGRKEDYDQGCGLAISLPFVQKIIAEIFGTYFLIFAGCGAVTINKSKGQITFPGVAIVWGLTVMVMVYSVGHISGAHFNPAVTFAFATVRRFPWRQVPAYVLAQMLGATLASGTLRLMFGGRHEHFPGTLPTGSDVQSLVLEFIITFYLMFVISGVSTDNRAIGELAGLAVGATILLNVLIAGYVHLRCCFLNTVQSYLHPFLFSKHSTDADAHTYIHIPARPSLRAHTILQPHKSI